MSIDDRVEPTVGAASRGELRLPRVSLRTWLLLFVIVALMIANLSTVAHLRQRDMDVAVLKAEVYALRTELRYLSVEDPTKLHVLNVPTAEEHTWKWRIYLPPGRRYKLYRGVGLIEAAGFSASTASNEIEPGEHFLTARAGRNEGGGWSLRTISTGRGGHGVAGFDNEGAERLDYLSPDPNWQTKTATDLVIEIPDHGEWVELLRHRKMKKISDREWQSTDEPMPGALLWINCEPVNENR